MSAKTGLNTSESSEDNSLKKVSVENGSYVVLDFNRQTYQAVPDHLSNSMAPLFEGLGICKAYDFFRKFGDARNASGWREANLVRFVPRTRTHRQTLPYYVYLNEFGTWMKQDDLLSVGYHAVAGFMGVM